MVVDIQKLSEIRTTHAQQKIVFADGTFDLFHLGHVRALEQLKQMGDIVVIAVLSDEWVKMKKNTHRPILTQDERVELVDSIRYVDYTILAFNKKEFERIRVSTILETLRPDVFVTVDETWSKKEAFFTTIKTKLEIVPRIHESSTTNLISRIKDSF